MRRHLPWPVSPCSKLGKGSEGSVGCARPCLSAREREPVTRHLLSALALRILQNKRWEGSHLARCFLAGDTSRQVCTVSARPTRRGRGGRARVCVGIGVFPAGPTSRSPVCGHEAGDGGAWPWLPWACSEGCFAVFREGVPGGVWAPGKVRLSVLRRAWGDLTCTAEALHGGRWPVPSVDRGGTASGCGRAKAQGLGLRACCHCPHAGAWASSRGSVSIHRPREPPGPLTGEETSVGLV